MTTKNILEKISSAAIASGATVTAILNRATIDFGEGCVVDITVKSDNSIVADGGSEGGYETFRNVEEFLETLRFWI